MNLIDALIRECSSFYKKASIESDMAKRIMLSIIPQVMSQTERTYTGGFDLKALRSAVFGAKDLIKYGTLACARELSYYKDMSENKEYLIINLIKHNGYLDALSTAEKLFLDDGKWDRSYGGRPWAKIAKVLYQLEEKRQLLEQLRSENASPSRNPNKDYITMEVEAMKEIVVLMNVFDGLAHNSGSIMPKVLSEEENDEDHKELSSRSEVNKMMDAKELHNPIDVYREVQHIIERPDTKHLFKDWITRIKTSPEYGVPANEAEKIEAIKKIKIRKVFANSIQEIQSLLRDFATIKDGIIREHDENKKRTLYRASHKILLSLSDQLISISDMSIYYPGHHYDERTGKYSARIQDEHTKKCMGQIKLTTKSVRDMIWGIINSIDDDLMDRKDYNDNLLVSDFHTIKKMIWELNGLIESI